MAAKVYWKGLRLVLGKVKRYIDLHYVQLAENLDATDMEAVDAVRAATDAALIELPVDTPIT